MSIGTWNVTSMNQGKLEVVKQETANGKSSISELKLTGVGKFNLDDYYIYSSGQQSLRRIGVALIVNKRVQNGVLGSNLKNNRMVSVHFQGKSFNITLTQVYTPTTHVEEAKVQRFYEDL